MIALRRADATHAASARRKPSSSCFILNSGYVRGLARKQGAPQYDARDQRCAANAARWPQPDAPPQAAQVGQSGFSHSIKAAPGRPLLSLHGYHAIVHIRFLRNRAPLLLSMAWSIASAIEVRHLRLTRRLTFYLKRIYDTMRSTQKPPIRAAPA